MPSPPTSKNDLIAVLRSLAERRPRTKADLRQLQDESVALALHIQRRMSLSDVPETIWHFLSDADIRFKDEAYAQLQLNDVRRELDAWGI